MTCGCLKGETSRNTAFCAYGILQTELFIVTDAQTDKRFADNPQVAGTTRIRFFAGAPLITPGGHTLGMLCVKDQIQRELSADQKAALQALSRQVVAQLELRRCKTDLGQAQKDLMNVPEEVQARVQQRTAELLKTNQALKAELAERRESKQHLREGEEEFRQLTENIADVFWITNRDDRIRIAVWDNGAGITAENLPAFFRMVSRPRKTATASACTAPRLRQRKWAVR